jgi:glycosyltransferase involved in cell wall biosynthesis
VAEAMAAGCPVIASNNSSLPEVVGDETWLVDPTQRRPSRRRYRRCSR